MKVFVTGGTGFLGSNLILRLLEKKYEVVVFDIAPLPENLKPVSSDFVYIQGDQSSETQVYRAIAEHRPEGIIHLGGVMGGICETNPLKAFDINVRSTLVLADAAVHLNIKKFFYASTIGIYAPNQPVLPVPQDGRIYPIGIYGSTKAASEFILSWYAQTYNLDVRGVRPASIWGPRRQHGLSAVLSHWLDELFEGKEICIDGADAQQSWIYIDDAVNAILALWEADTARLTQKFYNLAGDIFTPRTIMAEVKKILPDAKISYVEKPNTMNGYNLPALYDDTALRTDTGWTPSLTMAQAINRHFETLSKLK